MADYRYVARRYADGKRVRGRREARDQLELTEWLESQSLYPLSVSESRRFRKNKRSVSLPALAVFCSELGSMLDAGLSLLQVLRTLGEHGQDRSVRELADAMRAEIEGGASIAEAWDRHCDTFREIGAAVIAAGEASGRLPDMLRVLGGYLENAADIRARVKGMLWYPAVLAVTATLMTGLFVTLILPRFAMLLEALNVELPALTRFVLAVAHFCGHYWWAIIIAVAAGVGLVAAALVNTTVRGVFDAAVLKLPVVGTLVTLSASQRFARTAGVLLESGLPASEAFSATAQTISNRAVRERLVSATMEMNSGTSVSEAIEAQNVFFPLAMEMIHVGEQTGRLPDMLMHLGGYCETALSRGIKRLSALLEPAIMLPVAALVATIVISMLLPYFKLVETIK